MTFEERFANLSVTQILTNYEFSHRFLAYFASQCAKKLMKQLEDHDPKSLKAIEIAERFGNGEDFSKVFSKEELKEVHDGSILAFYKSTFITSKAYAAAHDAYAYVICYYFSNPIKVYTLLGYSYSFCEQTDKPLLLDLIKTRMTKLEKLFIFGVV